MSVLSSFVVGLVAVGVVVGAFHLLVRLLNRLVDGHWYFEDDAAFMAHLMCFVGLLFVGGVGFILYGVGDLLKKWWGLR